MAVHNTTCASCYRSCSCCQCWGLRWQRSAPRKDPENTGVIGHAATFRPSKLRYALCWKTTIANHPTASSCQTPPIQCPLIASGPGFPCVSQAWHGHALKPQRCVPSNNHKNRMAETDLWGICSLLDHHLQNDKSVALNPGVGALWRRRVGVGVAQPKIWPFKQSNGLGPFGWLLWLFEGIWSQFWTLARPHLCTRGEVQSGSWAGERKIGATDALAPPN